MLAQAFLAALQKEDITKVFGSAGDRFSEVAIKEEKYTGISINTAKKRITGHNGNIRHREQKGTRLSAHIWELKDKNIPYTLSWSILTTASGYNPSNKQCRLCLLEKWYILFQEENATLNRRLEIFSSCRHKARLTLNPKAIKDD